MNSEIGVDEIRSNVLEQQTFSRQVAAAKDHTHVDSKPLDFN